MATLLMEHFGFSSSNRDQRAVRRAGERAADALAGRTVWCATALTAGEEPALTLQRHLSGGGELNVRRLELGADETLMGLSRSVEPILRGGVPSEVKPTRLGSACATAAAVDAYLLSWREADRYGRPAAGVAALMPCGPGRGQADGGRATRWRTRRLREAA
jgi:hypothetical protein